ncbi:MAG: PDZ domain-containing protein [Myxococcota bacterium]
MGSWMMASIVPGAAVLALAAPLGAPDARAQAPDQHVRHREPRLARPGPADAPDLGAFDRVPAKGHLGIAPLAISPALRQALGAPSDRGVLVDDVVGDSPAEKAGLRPGDVVTMVDGKPVTSREDILDALAGKKAGDVVEVRTLRKELPFVRWAKLERDVPVASADDLGGFPVGRSFQFGPDDLEQWQRRMQDQLDAMRRHLPGGSRPGAPGSPDRDDDDVIDL